jgi:energy-coupling factor transporter transmembrane protein EcfT
MPKFEFEWRDSPIHKMHPIPKFMMIASLASISSIWMDPRYLIFMITLSTGLFLLAKAPLKWLWMPFLFSLGANWATFLTQVPFMTDPNLYKVYDPVWASLTFVNLGTVPIFGHLAYTYGSLLWWLGRVMRFYTIAIFANTLYYTTNIAELIHYFTKLKLPKMVTFSFLVVFRFFPVMLKLSTEVTHAQTVRGWEMKSRNPVTFIKKMTILMYPVCRQFMRTTDVVTLSVVNRAFGANPIRPHKHWTVSKVNLAISVLLWVAFAVLFYFAANPPFIGNL